MERALFIPWAGFGLGYHFVLGNKDRRYRVDELTNRKVKHKVMYEKDTVTSALKNVQFKAIRKDYLAIQSPRVFIEKMIADTSMSDIDYGFIESAVASYVHCQYEV